MILVDQGAGGAAGVDKVLPEADLILVPVLPSQADIWATQRYLKMALVRRKTGARIALFIIGPNRRTHRARPGGAGRAQGHGRHVRGRRRAARHARPAHRLLPQLERGAGCVRNKGQEGGDQEFGRLANATMALL